MKISFPYMGCVTGYKRIFEKLGHEVIMPPKPTERTFELGVKYSPEFICYPFKVMLGTYFEVIEKGAEVIVSSAGTGPCRAGYYPEIHDRILKQEGFNVPIITFDSFFQNPKEFLRKVKLITNRKPIHKVIKALLFGFKLICHMDDLEKKIKILRAYEIEKGAFNKAWKKIIKMFDKCETFKDLKHARVQAESIFGNIPMKDVAEDQKIRVGIVGEIYVVMESSSNMDVEQKLNDMGVEVENVQYISDWIKHNILPAKINRHHSHKLEKKAEKYTTINCGGHDKENMGAIMDYAERGFDAVVHLMPFSCLPELVTRSVAPTMSEDLGMPILSISMDEQTGTANMQTRLEAFIELVANKKKSVYRIPVFKEEKPKTKVEVVFPSTVSELEYEENMVG